MSRCTDRGRLALLLTLSLLTGASFGKTLTLRVLGPIGEIPPYAISGFNVDLSMPVALQLEEFGALAIEALRFPPGEDADNHPLTEDVMDAFKRQWQLLGQPEVLLVANFFEGPEHAAAAARYLEEIDLPVRLWEIGNEPDLYPSNRMDPSWTAEVYCERFRAFARTLKAVDPEIRVAGPAVSGSRPLGKEYLREVLRLCGDVIDILSWHVYPTDGTWEDQAALATSSEIGEEISLFREWLKDPKSNPLGFERDVELAITEFGLSWNTPNFHHLEDMVAAVWLADALGQMASQGLDLSHYFALQAMGGHGLIDSSGWIRPTYYVYEMLSDFSGEALDVEGEGDLMRAYAARNESGLRLLLVNRSPDDVEVVLELDVEAQTLDLETLSGEIFDSELGYRESTQAADQPILVPAHGVVTVRSGP